jgi:hypothetical protein
MVRDDLNLKGKIELFEEEEAPDFPSLTEAQREALRSLGRSPQTRWSPHDRLAPTLSATRTAR